MKTKAILVFLFLICSGITMAQQDSLKAEKNNDTIRVGGIIILKKGKPNEQRRVTITVSRGHRARTSKIQTNTFFFDLGLANWSDKTNYAVATSRHDLVNQPGASDLSEKDFKLRTGKSVNVNLWIIGQTVSLAKHYVNLKYAFGLELNNYRFQSNISFNKGGFNPYVSSQDIPHAFVFRDSINFTKNKLAADYFTIPVMLNFKSNPNYNDRGVSLSAGVSMGYLYSSRNKQKSEARGKQKNRGDYDLRKWKFSYVGEIGIGFVHLYGSYSPKSIFTNNLDFNPYTIGLRFSGW